MKQGLVWVEGVVKAGKASSSSSSSPPTPPSPVLSITPPFACLQGDRCRPENRVVGVSRICCCATGGGRSRVGARKGLDVPPKPPFFCPHAALWLRHPRPGGFWWISNPRWNRSEPTRKSPFTPTPSSLHTAAPSYPGSWPP